MPLRGGCRGVRGREGGDTVRAPRARVGFYYVRAGTGDRRQGPQRVFGGWLCPFIRSVRSLVRTALGG